MTHQKGSSTTTTETRFPDWVTDSQQTADAWRDKYFQDRGTTGADLAPLTSDQRRAGDLIRNIVTRPGTNYAEAIMQAGAPVTGKQIAEGMNPFLDTVGRGVMHDMRRNRDIASARIGARNANAVAFGGSGPALERAQLNRSHGENVARTIGQLLSGGWDRSQQLAENNANRAMTAASMASGAEGDELARIDSLMRYGTLEQAQDQAERDRMRTLIDWYSAGVPAVVPGVSETQPIMWNPLETVLGVALTGSRVFGG